MKKCQTGWLTPLPDVTATTIFVYCIGLLIVLHLIFANNVACLLFGLDGTSWVTGFGAQASREPFSQVGVDPLQGNFDAYYPAFREYFVPEALALLFTGTGAGKAMTYTTYGMLMVLATYALARSLEFSRRVGLFSGALLAATALPTNLSGESWLYGIYNLVPHLAQVVSLTSIIVACFWALEGRRPITRLGLALVSVATVMLSVVSFVPMTILMLPTIAVYGGASIFSNMRTADILFRVAMAAACVIIPLVLGMVHYTIAAGGYTAYRFFEQEFMQSRASLDFASILYQGGLLGKIVIIISLIGAVWAILIGPRKIRIFAWTHIIATFSFHAVALLVVQFAEGYHGPSPLYFEFVTWPMMFIFIGFAVSVVLERTSEILRLAFNSIAWGVDRIADHGLLGAVPVFLVSWNVAIVASQHAGSCKQVDFFPIQPTAITERLERTIAIRAGTPFRGLVATFDGAQRKPSVDWFSLHGSDGQLWRSSGNDHRLVGLWQYNIPTLMQYSPLISPPYYLLLSEFLSRPTDRQLRSVLVLTRPNERMLKLWGVRFVIADFDPRFGQTEIEMPVPGQDPVRLVELAEPNLGDYSPTEVRQVDSFREGLRLMHETIFDGRRTLVTEYPLVGPFVPAQTARLVYQRSGFSVSASSTGQSILVLPIQYSRCWTVSGEGNPVLFRANMMQLGISFTGRLDTNLTFRFGPILASGCRIKDISDMERLGIREARAH